MPCVPIIEGNDWRFREPLLLLLLHLPTHTRALLAPVKRASERSELRFERVWSPVPWRRRQSNDDQERRRRCDLAASEQGDQPYLAGHYGGE